MAEGDVGGLARLGSRPRGRAAAPAWARSRWRATERATRPAACASAASAATSSRLVTGCEARAARGRVGRVLPGEGLELQLGEEGEGRGAVGLLALQGLGVEGDRHVVAQGDQALAEQRVLAVLLQPLAVGGPLHLVALVEHRLQRAELADQVARALVADAGHAGDVVHRVAHERQHVHHALGRHAQLLLDLLAVVEDGAHALAAGVQDQDVVVHELQQVLVARDHHHLEALRPPPAGPGWR